MAKTPFTEILEQIRGRRATMAEAAQDKTCIYGQLVQIKEDTAGLASSHSQLKAIGDDILLGDQSKINAVGADLVLGDNGNMTKVLSNIVNIDKVAEIDDKVTAVAGVKEDIVAVNANEANINKVVLNKTNIDKVAGNEENINKVALNEENINLAVGNKINIDKVALNTENIDKVALNEENINKVAGNEANINKVVENKINIDKVVLNTENIDSAVRNEANINEVANNKENINKAVGNKINIDKVVGMKNAIDNVVLNYDTIANAKGNADNAALSATESSQSAVLSEQHAEDAKQRAVDSSVSAAAAAKSAIEAQVPKINWRGKFNIDTLYLNQDAVHFSGSAYIAKAKTSGRIPTDETVWNPLALKGEDGLGAGDMKASVYDPDGKQANVFERAAHTGLQPMASITGLSDELNKKQNNIGFAPEDSTKKDIPNGYAGLDANGKITADRLPSFVDDVIEYKDITKFPPTGESGKIYINIATNITYRWSGTIYTPIGSDLALGETDKSAYRGDFGKIAYDHATADHAPSDAEKNAVISVAGREGIVKLTKKDVGLENADDTSDEQKPLSNAMKTALGLKMSTTDWGSLDNTSDEKKPLSTAMKTALNNKLGTTGKAADSGKLDGVEAKYIRGQCRGTTSQDPDVTFEQNIISNHANTPDPADNTSYWYIKTQFHKTIIGSINKSQLAIKASKTSAEAYIRSCIGGTWAPWVRIDNNAAASDSDKLGGVEAKYFMGQTRGVITDDPNATEYQYIVSNHINTPDNLKYWYIHTQFYNNSAGIKAQTAIVYAASPCEAYVRNCRSGTWSSWVRMDNNGTSADSAKLGGAEKDVEAKEDTIVQRDHAGNINATYFKSTIANQATIGDDDALCFRNGTGTDTFMRFAAAEAIMGWLTANGAVLTDTIGMQSTGDFAKTSGNLRFNNMQAIYFGNDTDNSSEFYRHSNNTLYLSLRGTTDVFEISDQGQPRFTFVASTGAFTATGNVTAYSDRKLKENIKVIPNALDKVATLSGYTFDRIDNPKAGRQTGVIAQELQKVLPEAVNTHVDKETGEETLSVAYGQTVGLLIEAIKDLKKEVDELKKAK